MTKQQQLEAKLSEADALEAKMKGNDAERTEENVKAFDAILEEVVTLQTAVVAERKQAEILSEAKSFINDPAHAPKVNPTGAGYQPASVKERGRILSVGEQFVGSDAYKNFVKHGRIKGDVSVEAKGLFMPSESKATFDLAGVGLDTATSYQAGPILLEQQRLTIRNLIPVGQTTLNSVPYIQETSYTNAATAVAEEGLKPEATFALNEATAPVRKIAVTAKVTDEMWNDFPMMRDYINGRLRFMVGQTEEDQLLNGSGTAPNLRGILNTSGIQTQALSGTAVDSIYKAMTKIRVASAGSGGFEPTGIVIHPNDWQDIRLSKDANNQYFGGGPFTGPYGVGGIAADRLWNLPVVVTTAITEGTALVGAWNLGAFIWQREGIAVEATNTNEDDFVYNRMTIRVEERLALAVIRPSAFCTVTGI